MDASRVGSRRLALAGLIVTLAVGVVVYRLLVSGKLAQTAALFIGLPAFLAVLLVLTARPRSATGLILTGMTVALLSSGILVGEGLICILMASPLFYLVGWLVGLVVDHQRRRARPDRADRAGPLALIVLPLLLASLEGVDERLAFPRSETVRAERIVTASADSVERTLAAPPSFDRALPAYLQLGFPRPFATEGSGLALGDRRAVAFGPGPAPAELVLMVVERRPGYLRFQPESDSTPIARWLTWRSAEVEWASLGADRTWVRWTLQYDRQLDPAWYFGPWERYGVGLAADYLIDCAATPR